MAEFEKIISAAIEECRRLGVREEYIQGFRELLDWVEVNQFRWSDISVVVGFRDFIGLDRSFLLNLLISK